MGVDTLEIDGKGLGSFRVFCWNDRTWTNGLGECRRRRTGIEKIGPVGNASNSEKKVHNLSGTTDRKRAQRYERVTLSRQTGSYRALLGFSPNDRRTDVLRMPGYLVG